MLSFLTCGPSSVSLDDASSSENADGDGIPDEQQEEDEPAIHFAAGGWSGGMGLYVKEWDWDVRGGDIDLDVNDDGTFEGQAICEAESDWGSGGGRGSGNGGGGSADAEGWADLER